ncbi:sigma-70 family RNA polymerase sigma factor [Patescibacteria group bacterium]|nr:sigma-70 family RNA polymerase sigma factor [Patescibacteria group bacterium]
MEQTDQELVASYIQGHTISFDLLVLRYLKLVYSVAFHYAKNQQDAEDISQDAFVKALQHIRSFDQEKPFKPWMLRIVRNQALDWLKKKKPFLVSDVETEEEGERLLESIPDPSPLADVLAVQHESSEEIVRLIATLPAEDRHLLFFRYVRGFSFKEIAGELHQVLDTVKSKHRRLLLKLRKIVPESLL